MARLSPAAELPTLWTTPDDLWQEFILPILREHDPEPHTGRPRTDQRKALDGIIFILRSGCQWNALPRHFGSDSAVHRTFQRWVKLGIFQMIWAALVAYARPLGLVEFEWQSSDTSMGKARFRGAHRAQTRQIGPNRGQNAAC
jgi:putative transposase